MTPLNGADGPSLTPRDEGTFQRPEFPRYKSSSKGLRARASLERLAAAATASSATSVPPVPQNPHSIAGTNAHNGTRGYSQPPNGQAAAKRRDDLWATFRNLDADLVKFRSKSANLRTNYMRNTLLPTLHRCASHSSLGALRPEDIDKRVAILNKWWTMLLSSLNGSDKQSQHPVANTDRPLYFEAIGMIMARPEFRYPFMPTASSPASTIRSSETTVSPGSASNDTNVSTPVRPTKPSPIDSHNTPSSKSSVESAGSSDFLMESICHNIRTNLYRNLLAQLAFCIDRMSLRHCPASLVSFSGRTCAYAFVYCPSVADTLVRLWGVSADGIRRVAAMYDPEFSMKSRASNAEEVARRFPPAIRSLAFSSHVSTVRMLRKRPMPPIAAQPINWFGPWTTRWSGSETDLFFLFVKHYHILIAEFISLPATPKQWLVHIPGLVLVQAQILRTLETRLSRSAHPAADEKANTSGANGQVTFDDLIDAAETTTTAVTPQGLANSLRQMSENRLLLLLRDAISDPQLTSDLRLVFVESVCDLLKALTRKTSLFDHNACFVLLDLMQEFLAVISSFVDQVGRSDLVDWDFWLDVFVQMLQSNNSLTEVRAFAFWFMVWDMVCLNEAQKRRLCLDILLSDAVFYTYFNHWSAMVRAYFHRLICWRLARFQGNAGGLNQEIFETLQRKLTAIYDFCMAYQDDHYLMTAPSQPAPGRQLLIAKIVLPAKPRGVTGT
ncbi:hypothetical protein KEM52_005980 [Ascosphaera acerosa]|nr:hypothetical protein KEM52_005980 [Ascosphaera acerosa]